MTRPHHEAAAERLEVGEELEGVGPPVGDIDAAGAFGVGADLFDGPSPEEALAGTPLAFPGGGFSFRDGVADVEDLADEAEYGAVGGIDREGVVREPRPPPLPTGPFSASRVACPE